MTDTPPRIETLWAYLGVGDDGGEGLAAASVGDAIMPLVAHDRQLIELLRPVAEDIAQQLKVRILLARFTVRVDEGFIDGRPSDIAPHGISVMIRRPA
jgi:hypothetical protein